jgi:hypothetical protein
MAVSDDVLSVLRRYDTPSVANAIETFNIRSWSEGYMSPEIRCMFPNLGIMAGYAVTGTIRAREKSDKSYSRHEWFDLIVSVPSPRVAVLQDLDDPPHGAFGARSSPTFTPPSAAWVA